MVKVKVGDILPAKDMKSGTAQSGKQWAMLAVKAEKGYDKITVWAENPADIVGAAAVKVVSVTDVVLKKDKRTMPDGTDRWYDNCNVTAKLEKAEGAYSGDDFVTVDSSLEDIFKL